jgi:hypothetical protein
MAGPMIKRHTPVAIVIATSPAATMATGIGWHGVDLTSRSCAMASGGVAIVLFWLGT